MSQSDFSRCAKAIQFLCAGVQDQPGLAEVAAQEVPGHRFYRAEVEGEGNQAPRAWHRLPRT